MVRLLVNRVVMKIRVLSVLHLFIDCIESVQYSLQSQLLSL